jgi:hypothetical protein
MRFLMISQKSQESRRSRGGGSPELLDLTGFPLSRNDEIGIKTTFYELIKFCALNLFVV